MLLQNEHCGRRYGTGAKQSLCALLSFALTLGLIISGRSTRHFRVLRFLSFLLAMECTYAVFRESLQFLLRLLAFHL